MVRGVGLGVGVVGEGLVNEIGLGGWGVVEGDKKMFDVGVNVFQVISEVADCFFDTIEDFTVDVDVF